MQLEVCRVCVIMRAPNMGAPALGFRVLRKQGGALSAPNTQFPGSGCMKKQCALRKWLPRVPPMGGRLKRASRQPGGDAEVCVFAAAAL